VEKSGSVDGDLGAVKFTWRIRVGIMVRFMSISRGFVELWQGTWAERDGRSI